MEPIVVYGEVENRAIAQLRRCAEAGDAVAGVLCADAHVGYSQPIGGAVAYENHISPSGVGYDIACGNKAVRTDIALEHLPGTPGANEYTVMGDYGQAIYGLMDEIFRRISFGVGRKNNEPVDHPVIDAIGEADFVPQRGLKQMAAQQLGTVGSGNHYVDLFAGDDGYLWVGVHFGSRGFGHKTASGFLALAEGKRFGEHATEGEMDSPPVLFHCDSELGQSYIAAMSLAGEYAYAGRDTVVNKVLEILGAKATYEVHNHHNFAWYEHHFGKDVWVVRKGCTPAFPHQAGFVGATMAEPSVILEGRESTAGIELMYSTVHGAGRVMSRTQAAGKSRKRWTCNNRDCGWYQGQGQHKPEDGRCPWCGHDKLSKHMVQMKAGEINWPEVQAHLERNGIELRGGGADEAPGAYKRLNDVLGWHRDSVRVLHELHPLGVAMAGADTFDPYKD